MTSIPHTNFIEKRQKVRYHPQTMLIKSISFTGSHESPRYSVKDFHDSGIGFSTHENFDQDSLVNIRIDYAGEIIEFITCVIKSKVRLGAAWRYGCQFHIRDNIQRDTLKRMTTHALNKDETNQFI